MATITVRIMNGASPVVGAQVIVGEIVQAALITDANGNITKTVPADFAIFSSVATRVDGVLRANCGPILFEAGGIYTIDIAPTAPA